MVANKVNIEGTEYVSAEFHRIAMNRLRGERDDALDNLRDLRAQLDHALDDYAWLRDQRDRDREQYALDLYLARDHHKAEHAHLNKLVEHLTERLIEAAHLMANPPLILVGDWLGPPKKSYSHWGMH